MVNNKNGGNVLELHNAVELYKKGIAAEASGSYKFAVTVFSKLLKIDPDDIYSYFLRGNAFYKLDDHNNAIQDYSSAIKLYPQLALLYNKRGIAYEKIGEQQRAIKDYSRAILLKPNYSKAYYNRAIAYSILKKYKLCIQDFSMYISLHPDSADAYNKRATVYFLQGKDDFGNSDTIKACVRGNCELLDFAKSKMDTAVSKRLDTKTP